MEENYEEYNDDYPCNTCGSKDCCDGWEARFCCAYCRWACGEDVNCDDCDPMDI